MLSQSQIDGVIAFHGHSCPGLAFGIRAGEWALEHFGRAEDEEIVAVVESDMCAVDAVQYLVGCTIGKGNFIWLDYGKNAFTFYRRRDGKNARLMSRGGLLLDLRQEEQTLDPNDSEGRAGIRQQMIERVMNAEFENIFAIGPAQHPMPHTARIHKSFPCDACGELTAEHRLLKHQERTFCLPCRAKIG